MLSKNGWGYRSFIIGGSILLIALLFATFYIIRLYSGLPNLDEYIINPIEYEMIEDKLNYKSLEYIEKYYENEITSGVIVVSTDNLKKYGLISESDLTETNTKDKCKGYSLIRKDEELTSESFIKCNNYTSEGYQSWRVGNE